MKKAINTNIRREFKDSNLRFMSIVALIFLGVFIFIGLKVSGSDIRNTALNYFDKYKLSDAFVTSTIGLTEKDLDLIEKNKNVDKVEGGYVTDLVTKKNDEPIRILSLTDEISKLEIVKGRVPEKNEEIILDSRFEKKYKINDKIELTEKDGKKSQLLKKQKYTVVGFMNFVEYIDKSNLGYSTNGGASLKGLGFVSSKEFNIPVYSIARVTYKMDIDKNDKFESKYNNLIEKYNDELLDELNEKKDTRIPNLKYNVLDREDYIVNYTTFRDGSYRIDTLSNIFPVFFFAVAILVTLSTMIRMVDEQRNYLGILKSLGYSDFQIMKKYIYYGLLSGLLGCALGAILGNELLPRVVYIAYGSNYIFKDMVVDIYPMYIIYSFIISLTSTMISAIFVAKTELRHKPIYLLNKKPPKKGSRIFLERIKPIWTRMSFNNKVTARNIFRYKVRMMMTILGVAGCTALLVIGIGIRDSMSNISSTQYGEIAKYDIIASFDSEQPKTETDKFVKGLNDLDNIKSTDSVYYDRIKVEVEKGKYENISLFVTNDSKKFDEFISLRTRKDKKKLELNDNSAIISEKLAGKLKISEIKDDKIKLKDSDNNKFKVKIDRSTEWYTGHNMFMSKKYYDEVAKKEAKPNAFLIKLDKNSKKDIEKATKDISKLSTVKYVVTTEDNTNMINSILDGMNLAVVVMIICSLLLAYVVLFNLININVSERIVELSTVKVLGFYPKEVSMYIFKETFILTLLGILVGYIAGIGMHQYIIFELPPNDTMFIPDILLSNFAISGVLTVIFAVIVMLLMHRRINSVDMLEALKSGS